MVTASIVAFHHSYREMLKILNCLLSSPVSIVYIIDNSTNDALRLLNKESVKVRYIHSLNIGYGSAHNVAIREAIDRGTKYHVVVNPDVYFEEDIIKAMVEYMDEHSDVGLMMPKVLYPNGELQYLCKLLPTPMDLVSRRFLPFKKYVQKRNLKYELRFTGYDTIMEVPSLSGCFMFMRADILKEIGGFDERFFMYAEDIDLCRRIGEVSKTIYYPLVSLYHGYEKGSYKNLKLFRYHLCSIYKYFNKWGWFFDKKQKVLNKMILDKYSYRNK